MAALARCRDGDPQRAVEAIGVAERPHLHLFIATSDIHLKHKLKMSREDALADAVKWVALGARDAGPRRRDRVLGRGRVAHRGVVPARGLRGRRRGGRVDRQHPGHRRLRDPRGVRRRSSGSVVDLVGRDATVSVHCHNDLGLATANTLAAVQAGARQVEVTVNGLGERAGNASLEEVVMALRTRPNQFPELAAQVQTEQLTPASRLVSYLTGFAVQPNKAIVGANAFAHESGIHQDGFLKNPLTYEIMTPQSVGLSGSTLSIGKLSGRRGLQGKLRELGHEVDGEALDAVYRAAIALADSKKDVTDADLIALVEQRQRGRPAVDRAARLEHQLVQRRPLGGQRVARRGRRGQGRATPTGNGPVNALFAAVDEAVQPVLGWHPVLTEYEIKAVSAGEDAQGQVLVRCRRSHDEGPGALVVTGHGLSTNIIEASLEAYLVAANKLHGAEINGIEVAFVGRRTAEELP